MADTTNPTNKSYNGIINWAKGGDTALGSNTGIVASKVGTATVGSSTKPIYLNAGVPTAFSGNVGGTAKPVYLNAGAIAALSATVGAADVPVYLNAGTISACTSIGNGSMRVRIGTSGTNNGDIWIQN